MNFEDLKDNLKIAGIVCSLLLAIAIPLTVIAQLIVYDILTMTGTTANAALVSTDMSDVVINGLDFGTPGEGDNFYYTKLKNVGNVPLLLSMEWDETNPLDDYSSWMTFVWTPSVATLNAGAVTTVDWTLTLDPTYPKDTPISITVTITGAQT